MLYPHPQIFHPLKTIFVHVPKAAGTSIENTLKEPGAKCGGHSTALAYRRKFPTEFASYFKFAVVRHPIDRFISAWKYLRRWPLLNALNNEMIHGAESADAFLAQAKAKPEMMRKIIHLWPQWEFVCDKTGKVIVDQLYRYEAIEDAWKDICARTGANKPLPKMNAAPDRLPLTLNADSLAFLREFYARDFTLFGYPAVGRTANEHE